MHFCFFLFFFAFLLTPGFADDTVWNCHQDKNSKEWVCTGEKASPADTGGEPLAQQPKSIPPAPAEVKETAVSESAPAPIPEIRAETKAQPKPVAEKQIVVKPTVRKAIAVKENLRQEDNRQAGWRCKAAEGGEDWNCNLTGPDPKGRTRVVAAEENGFSLLEPAFDSNQEQIFANLASNLKYDPWYRCSIEPTAAPAFTPGRYLRDVSPLDVNADYGEVFENEISSYKGNVEITRADQHSISNTAQYDSVSQTLDLQGEVYYNEDNLSIYSNSANLKLAQDQAVLRNVQFINPSAPLRGSATAAYRESQTLLRYKGVAYTTCPPGNTDWVVHASDLKVNDATGKGSAKNAWVEFKGAPVFYSPYLSFPTDARRLSGFLSPNYGNTQRGGFNISVPYYWNIAPNYDALFKPRYLTKRGLLLGSELRLLTPYSNSKVDFEVMPNDQLLNKARFLGSIKNTSQFGSYIHSNVDLNYVSDKQYFGDLGNALSFPNFSFVKSSADLGYTDKSKGISLTGLVENYQTIDQTLTSNSQPYRRLPQIKLDLDHAFNFMPLNAALDGEYTYFQHQSLVNGQRVNIKPSISSPLHSEWGFLTPKASLQYTGYQLSEKSTTDPSQSWPSTVSRTLPILSLDSGMTFERDLGNADSSLKHTIEPRLFYLYIPRKDQTDIPLFDTSRYDLWFSNLFRENSFSGTDRLQDANQITAALTTRLIDPASGREKLKFNIGEIIYFQNREVTAPIRIHYLPNFVTEPAEGFQTPAETGSFSPLVAELSSEFTDHWSGESGVQWNPQTNEIVRSKAVLHFVNETEKILNVGFNYRKDNLVEQTLIKNRDIWFESARQNNYNPLTDQAVIHGRDLVQSDLSFRWPLLKSWYAIGRWQYSWLYNNSQETFLGLEKENCCWRFRVIGRRWINGANTINSPNQQLAEGVSQTGVFFQVELKGLTGLGENLDKFFEQSIYGYQRPEK
ncbi:LPS assembly protein LptD [Methylomicrobium sp. Wu6]|uniref:LPS-assembly protein LptD n=1 Tax=Methylomicrobium sp. Wu6 TaxID=3107928 RepID=UPI002DD6B359|nr:LPS assembly protein LptD [Methylomicrobium sp. Wu6]MEC4748076.1 LPS assembly protein LptD [Methylomicrobium sp. Wu6]